ncbi:MAG: hypothetical protein JSR37_03175 [Verrucomicrobia bacterium]|nr:hypothetical protein [Verrucomicrobiota bacterium]MBS0636651.1 hypothetical protein [Verrucomicrobiota bacterium]
MAKSLPQRRDISPKLDAADLEFQKVAKEKARVMAEDGRFMHGKMLSQNLLQERYENELKQEFASFRKQLKNGASKIVETLRALSVKNPLLFADDVMSAFRGLSKLSLDQAFTEKISQGISLQELANVSDETIDKLYQGAKSLYENASYEDAGDAFLFLSNLNPKKYVFWLGLANARYFLKRYDEAVKAYTNACDTNPSDLTCVRLASRSWAMLGETGKALDVLDRALLVSRQNQEFSNWKPILEEERAMLLAMRHR